MSVACPCRRKCVDDIEKELIPRHRRMQRLANNEVVLIFQVRLNCADDEVRLGFLVSATFDVPGVWDVKAVALNPSVHV